MTMRPATMSDRELGHALRITSAEIRKGVRIAHANPPPVAIDVAQRAIAGADAAADLLDEAARRLERR